MHRLTSYFGLAILSVFIEAHPTAADEVEPGKAAFKKCALCHTAEPGKNTKAGPSLFGVVGRKSAALGDYNYSEAMRKFEQTWDEKTLDAYLADPRATVPGTKMIYPGIKDKKERDDIIAFLETLK